MSLTPEQFNKLAIKEDLKEFNTKEEAEKQTEKILSVLDSMAKDIKDIKVEQSSNIGSHDRFEKILKDHEGRIKSLEKYEKRRVEKTNQ